MTSMSLFFRGLLVPFQGLFLIFTSLKLLLLAFIPFWIAVFGGIYLIYSFWSQTDALLPVVLQ